MVAGGDSSQAPPSRPGAEASLPASTDCTDRDYAALLVPHHQNSWPGPGYSWAVTSRCKRKSAGTSSGGKCEHHDPAQKLLCMGIYLVEGGLVLLGQLYGQ